MNKIALILILTILHVAQALENPKSSFVMTTEQTEQYQLALNYRDGKIEGCSADESQGQAAALFLELAKLRHPNSMHNYALIQYKLTNYELAAEWFIRAANCGVVQSKNNFIYMVRQHHVKNLSLVIGSTRQSGSGGGQLINQIWRTEETDLTHTKSFDGQAVTFDLQPSVIPSAPHIVGDCLTYDFSKFVLQSVYLERPPTAYGNAQNFISDSLSRLKPYMIPGTKLMIEWHPYTLLAAGYNLQDLENFRQQNPFNGWDEMNIGLQGFFVAAGDMQNLRAFPSDLASKIQVHAEKTTNLLQFYIKNGLNVPMSDLKDRIRMEAMITLDMLRPGEKKLTWLRTSPAAGITEFKQTFDQKKFIQHIDQLIGQRLTINNIVGTVYDPVTFLENSFINFILSDIAVMTNTPLVITYLEQAGFKDVSIVRRQNPHNLRQNVWMIEGVKA